MGQSVTGKFWMIYEMEADKNRISFQVVVVNKMYERIKEKM